MRILRRRPLPPKLAATGHALDDELLRQLSKRSDLRTPRHWVHYLYFPDEASARQGQVRVTSAGWELQTLEPSVDGSTWVLIAEKHDVVVDEAAVVAARQFFEEVAAGVPGGEYDGWEASL